MRKILTIILLVILILGVLSCSPGRRVLYIFNWTDYIAPELVRSFERQNNVRIVYDTYNSNENMLTKLLTSNAAYDIIVPSGDHVEIMRGMGLLSKIDKSLLNNYHNLDPMILSMSQAFDPVNEYSVPYFWGTMGFIYNTQYLSHEEMENVSWDILGDERFNGRNVVTMLDDIREVLGSAMIFNGYDPNDASDEALSSARETLMRWNRNVAQFDSDSFKNDVQDGTIWFGQAYNGDALQVMEENENVGFVLPREGSTIWVDFLVIPENSENKDLAHKFIDFLLDAKVGLTNAEWVQYATPNKATFELLPQDIQENRNIYPTDEFMRRSHLILNIGDDVLMLDEIWQELRMLRN
ncbi:MAG: spermidine/putrescine ABC transporter substrate-binding protein [Candidatus Cloacimonetes bacterium]|nr:spermidine/putrescine ABC transporter substrate-binding protein [Candidatus Cloacimonadota bacterium]